MIRVPGPPDVLRRGAFCLTSRPVSSSCSRQLIFQLLLIVPCVLTEAPRGSALQHIEVHSQSYDQELLEFASIPSISSMPQHQKDLQSAATWLVARLKKAGLKVIRRKPLLRNIVALPWCGVSTFPALVLIHKGGTLALRQH